MTRLFAKLAADELALGVWLKGGPHLIASLAKAGFDYVRPDMMFSAMDWKELDHILRASEAAGVTCCLRIPANPWANSANEMQVTVDAARAFSLGVPIVQVSVSSAAQVKALVGVAADWHRSGAGEYPSSSGEFEAQHQRVLERSLILPAIESGSALRELDEIMRTEGLRAVMISCTDFSKCIGFPFEYDHPEVWKAIDRIVTMARARNIIVAANTGYAYNTPEKIVGRVQALYDHGIRMVLIQGIEFLLERFCHSLLEDVAGPMREHQEKFRTVPAQ